MIYNPYVLAASLSVSVLQVMVMLRETALDRTRIEIERNCTEMQMQWYERLCQWASVASRRRSTVGF